MAPQLLLHRCAPPSLLLPHRPPRLLKHRLPVHRGLAMPTPAPQLPYPARTVIRQCHDSDQDREGRMRKEYPDKEDTLLSWSTIGVTLLGLGFVLGPILDGIHSNVELLVYANGAINIGPLKTNVVVPPLLSVFYSVVGLLQLALDKWIAPKDWQSKPSLRRVLISLITLVIILEASAEMYKAGTPYNIEAYILFAMAEINWVLSDGTWWGFGLAAAIGVICPLCEIPLMRSFDFWHYSRPNIEILGEGSVTWVLACYFSYVPFLANLARWLSSQNSILGNVGEKSRRP